MALQIRVYLREIADITYRVVAEMSISPHKHYLIQRTHIIVLYVATIRDIQQALWP